MSYSNSLLSDQSHKSANKYVQGFKLTDTGDYDMQNKKLVNVDEGDNNQDVVNKHQLDVGLQTKPNKTDVLLLDGTTHIWRSIPAKIQCCIFYRTFCILCHIEQSNILHHIFGHATLPIPLLVNFDLT